MNRDARDVDPGNPSFFNAMVQNTTQQTCQQQGVWGDAKNWACNAQSLGYFVDNDPEVGAVAQWTKANHVAYVEATNSDGSIVVSEYNYGADDAEIKHQYGVRAVAQGSAAFPFPDNFIHVARLGLSAPALNFGNQPAGTSSSQTVTLTNTRPGPILLNVSMTFSYANRISRAGAEDFALGQPDSCSGATLQPQAQCQLTVIFAPPSSTLRGGTQSAAVLLDWGSGPQLLPVSGVVLTDLAVPERVAFGAVTSGTSMDKVLTLINHTGADVSITSAQLNGSPNFALIPPSASGSPCGTILKSGTSCTITIAFSPTAKTKYSGALTISDTAINSPQIVNLTGTGTSQ